MFCFFISDYQEPSVAANEKTSVNDRLCKDGINLDVSAWVKRKMLSLNRCSRVSKGRQDIAKHFSLFVTKKTLLD